MIGTSGFGACRVPSDQLATLLGIAVDDLFAHDQGVLVPWLAFGISDLGPDRPARGPAPVYALAAAVAGATVQAPFQAPCYDTSLYFDDLHLASDEDAAELIAAEARDGYARGHRAFKIKVGRGARHMPLEAGTQRDIAIVRAVRAAIGPEPPLMLDANNGYNLNLAKRVLAEACRAAASSGSKRPSTKTISCTRTCAPGWRRPGSTR